MTEEKKKCMICAKPVLILKGGICEPCQDRIRREALGEKPASANAPTESQTWRKPRQEIAPVPFSAKRGRQMRLLDSSIYFVGCSQILKDIK
jgi:hypothetical protein